MAINPQRVPIGINFCLAIATLVSLPGCAYRTLQHQARDNYAYVRQANLEIDQLLVIRDQLLAERSRLSMIASSYRSSPTRASGGASSRSRSSSGGSSPTRSSSAGSGSSEIQKQIAVNESAIARNEAQIREAQIRQARLTSAG